MVTDSILIILPKARSQRSGIRYMLLPKGFESKAKVNASGTKYNGRFTCPDVQWIGSGSDAFCTFTVTAGQLTDAAISNILWTDQAVQRGIQPGSDSNTPRELSLASGYPDQRYIFDKGNADEMAQKLLSNEKLFLSPLIWNLRPGSFSAFYDEETRDVNIYSGKVYLPDSHHRHQAIIMATQAFRDAPEEYPGFNDEKQFKVELYFLSREDEGNYFFDKNQRPKPVAQSKAFDLSTEDDLSLLAKLVVEKSDALRGNVNRVTDRLSKRNADVTTLSTLREVMRTISATEFMEKDELEGLSVSIARAFDLISEVRPEIKKVLVTERNRIRETLLVDAGVMFHGYAGIIKDYINSIPRLGSVRAESEFREKLGRLSAREVYLYDDWSGDLFDRSNPAWKERGVVRSKASGGGISLVNTRESRASSANVLRRVIENRSRSNNLRVILEI